MKININYDKCIGYGCLECYDICPMNVFDIQEKTILIRENNNCCGCMVCIEICTYNALSFNY